MCRSRKRRRLCLPLLAGALLGALLLLSSCATVPLTERRSLNLVSDSELLSLSTQEYAKVLKKSKLSDDPERVQMVRKVGEDIARATEEFLKESGLESEIKNYKWEFNLIEEDKTVNAWCMPGGKVAVYTGILPLTQDENGLAVVMGHEIAHAIAKHGNERMSQALVQQLGGMALEVAVAKKPQETQDIFMTSYGIGSQFIFLLRNFL